MNNRKGERDYHEGFKNKGWIHPKNEWPLTLYGSLIYIHLEKNLLEGFYS